MNLDYVAPFANTSDLKQMTPKIDVDLARARELEREFKRKRGIPGAEDAEEDGDPQTVVMEEERDSQNDKTSYSASVGGSKSASQTTADGKGKSKSTLEEEKEG